MVHAAHYSKTKFAIYLERPIGTERGIKSYFLLISKACSLLSAENENLHVVQCFPTCGPRTPGGPRVIQKGSAG
jgi:hypothetical protein